MTAAEAAEILRSQGASLYQPCPLPGLDGMPALQPCAERLGTILGALRGRAPGAPYAGTRRGKMVDVGCHTGWFCREFAARGWEVVGIDRSAEWIGAARAAAPGIDFRVLDVLADRGRSVPASDVVLVLNVAMYWFDEDDPAGGGRRSTSASVERGWETLERVVLSGEVAFFESGGIYAGGMPFAPPDAGEAIGARVGRRSLPLDPSALGRPMFMLLA